MGTKLDDVCLKKAADDEPLFVIRLTDIFALAMVDYWIGLNEPTLGPSHEKIVELRLHRAKILAWQGSHPEKVKHPGRAKHPSVQAQNTPVCADCSSPITCRQRGQCDSTGEGLDRLQMTAKSDQEAPRLVTKRA